MESWLVPYKATVRGVTVVEAISAEDAVARVEAGVFDLDNGQEMTDWAATGSAKENK
jgi:hypothetical protein